MNAEQAFIEVEHTADWALHIRGPDLRALLVNAAHGLRYLLVPDDETVPSGLTPAVTMEITLDAYDAESLLVNWLTELAYWTEKDGVVFHTFVLDEVMPTHLHAVVQGGPVTNLQKHVKAVTYHNLEIVATEQGLEATVVFDV